MIHLPKMKYKKGLFKNKYCLCWYINTFVVLTKSLLRVLSIIFQNERRYFLRLQNEPSAESRFLWNSAEDIKFNIWRSRRLSLLKWFKWSVNRQILILKSFSIGFSSLCHPGVFIFGIFFLFSKQKTFMSLLWNDRLKERSNSKTKSSVNKNMRTYLTMHEKKCGFSWLKEKKKNDNNELRSFVLHLWVV